ncbi:MAG: hypothetical protein CMJ90_05785 [Planctomycetes bacterium]|nr:hypothetical protein [Planctomycetota bacterium]
MNARAVSSATPRDVRPEQPTNMKQEPRPGDGVPIPRQPAKNSKTRGASVASRTQEKTPELHHILRMSRRRART